MSSPGLDFLDDRITPDDELLLVLLEEAEGCSNNIPLEPATWIDASSMSSSKVRLLVAGEAADIAKTFVSKDLAFKCSASLTIHFHVLNGFMKVGPSTASFALTAFSVVSSK